LVVNILYNQIDSAVHRKFAAGQKNFNIINFKFPLPKIMCFLKIVQRKSNSIYMHTYLKADKNTDNQKFTSSYNSKQRVLSLPSYYQKSEKYAKYQISPYLPKPHKFIHSSPPFMQCLTRIPEL